MKDFRPALAAFLLGESAISNIVNDRVFPLRLPQGEVRPSVVYTRISGQGGFTMEGPDGLAKIRLQLDAWASDEDTASRLADAIKVKVNGYSGVMGSGADAVEVQGVFFADERERFDDLSKLCGMSRDYFMIFEER